MNIKQALKKKNILVDNIKKEFSKLETYNSIESGNVRSYSPTESLRNYIKLTDELIALKTSIHITNRSIYGKIFRLSELKSMVKYLKSLNCSEGMVSEKWGSSTPKLMTTEIGIIERDNIVIKMEEEINTIQDDLDYFNQVTELEEINKEDLHEDYFHEENSIIPVSEYLDLDEEHSGYSAEVSDGGDEGDKDDLPF